MQKASCLCLTLCAVTAWWPLKPCFAETQATGTISGRVVTGGGAPLRRAIVVIEEVLYADGSTETLEDATTDDNGQFSFSDLAPARYRLEAEKSGYVAARLPPTKGLVRLNSGDIVNDVTLRMVPVSVVGGYVLDGNGDPLAKAVIRLLQYRYYPGGRRLTVAREAISDERGEYRIGDLNPGSYYVVASYHSRISDVVCPPVYYPGVPSFDDATPVRLLPSDETSIKFGLLPGRPVHVRGRVVGWAGGVRVFLIPRGGVPYAQLLSVDTYNGWFHFKGGVLPGDYVVLAASLSRDELLEGSIPITVGDHDLNDVSVLLTRIAHRLLWVSAGLGPNLVPMQGVVISLHPTIVSNQDSIIAAQYDVFSDAREISTRDGNPIDLPYPGPFVVSAEKLPGDFYIEGADFHDERDRGPQMPGTQQLFVRLNPHGGSVEGVVLDSTDHPLPGAVVAAVPQDASKDGVDQSRTTTTDQYGQFVLHGLANTMYGIYAWDEVPDGAYYYRDFLSDYSDTALSINISSDNHYQVKLHAASTNEE